jgi:hypothetical protein
MYNRRYYENGGDTMQPDSSGQGIMQAAPQDMQQGMQQPQLADQAQQPQIKDPQHALQIIIQMLVAQGIPPEQAKQIAMEMIKAVAEGGMQEVTSDDRIHARFGGVMYNGREHYGLGSIVGSIIGGIGGAASGLVKGVANVVKSIAGSSLGKMALLAAAAYFGGPLLFGEAAGAGAATAATTAAEEGLIGQGLGNATLSAAAPTAAGSSLTAAAPYASGLPSAALTPASASIGAPSLLSTASSVASDPSWSGIKSLGSQALSSMIPSSVTDAALKYGPSVLGGVIGGSLTGGMPQQQPGESNADFQKRVDEWNSKLSTNMSSPTFNQGAFPNNPFYSMYARKADGGRIGYAFGGFNNFNQQRPGQLGQQPGGMNKIQRPNMPMRQPLLGPIGALQPNNPSGFGSMLLGQQPGMMQQPAPGQIPSLGPINNNYNPSGMMQQPASSGMSSLIPQQPTLGGLQGLLGYQQAPGGMSFIPQPTPDGLNPNDMMLQGGNIGLNQSPMQYAADGGRIGYEDGGITNIIHQATKEGFFGNNMLAHGGVPTGTPRQNQHGVKEIDYRDRGGYVPPIGVKEKADDIPAMLSNNEFVFTADAVRNAGHGNVNKGAQRMYKLMKHLEAGGVVA